MEERIFFNVKWRFNEDKLENWPILIANLSNSHRDGSMGTTLSMILKKPVKPITSLKSSEIYEHDT